MVNRKVFLGLISVFLPSFALGGQAIPNWSAPATWSPARAHTGLATMGDVTNPLPFIGADPCRIADTRLAAGPYGAPALAGGVPRNFTLTGQCGIPAGAGAVSLNVTVTNTQGAGFILIYPAGGAQPTVSTLNYVGGQTIANAAVVPLGVGGAITVIAGVSGTDLILDTNGYYASTPAAASNYFKIVNSGPFAIFGETSSSSTDATGVLGRATASTGITYGVWGQDFSTSTFGIGVLGISYATTGQTYGVFGRTNSTSNGAVGTYGEAVGTTGTTYGVSGFSSSIFVDSAGVYGVDGTGPPAGSKGRAPAGIRGESKNYAGVLGQSQGAGVIGLLRDSTGSVLGVGYLGVAVGSSYAMFADGNLGVSGAKMFVEPHPSDASKVIRYVSLEGPESGTYFRGTSRTIHGEAIIEVPESFRIVTDEDGLTVQLTPVGTLATLAVISQDLNRIVVRSSKDVTFHYLAQGIRRAFKDHQAISDGQEFMPGSAEERMPLYLTEEVKRRLISNGTYNADGTVNMETAERAGWMKIWADREAQAKAAAAANAATRAVIPGEK